MGVREQEKQKRREEEDGVRCKVREEGEREERWRCLLLRSEHYGQEEECAFQW